MSEPAHETPPTGHRRAAVLAVVVLLGVAVAVYFVWPASGSKTAYASTGVSAVSPVQPASASSGSPAQAAAVGAPKQPVGPVAMKPGNPSHVAAWNAGPGGTALAAVSANVGTILMARGAGRFLQMRQACVSLAAEVKEASTQSPIPDTAMENLYTKALASLASGAANCEAGISSKPDGDEYNVVKTDSALLTSAMSALDVGTGDLYRATADVKTLKKPQR
jgi:hypothetical protein